MIKQYILYLLRWQITTPVVAICLSLFSNYGVTVATIIANFIGGLIFFWIDKWIFKNKK